LTAAVPFNRAVSPKKKGESELGSHRSRVRLHSFDGRYLCSVPIENAYEMLSKGSAEIAGAHRGLLTSIKLLPPEPKYPSPRSGAITSTEAQNNALAHVGAKLSADEKIGTYQRVLDKISTWPEIYDDRALVVCAGRVRGQQ
jgi:hypothetical protein